MSACNASLNMNGAAQSYYHGQGVNTGNYGAHGTGYDAAAAGHNQYNNQNPNDCVQVIRTMKRVVVPCTRNVVKNVTVQVPRTVVNKVRKQLPYQDVEARTRAVPYITNREEVRYTNQNQQYTTLVPRVKTRMVPVTRRVPKTIYVNEVSTEPRHETVMVPEIRQRSVRIPYKVQVPETKYHNQTYHVPVTKYKTVFEDVPRTIYEPQTKQHCTKVTKMITKDIPVYNAIPRTTGSCPPNPQSYGNIGTEFKAADTNHNGVLSMDEYANARTSGMLQETAARPTEMGYSTYDPSSRVARGVRHRGYQADDGPETPLN